MILQSLNLRNFSPDIVSCPGCGRTSSSKFIELAQYIADYVKQKEGLWKSQGKKVEKFKVAVMGCIVNGPGESRGANIGFSLPGYGEKGNVAVYIDGNYFITLQNNDFSQIKEEAIDIINKYIAGI